MFANAVENMKILYCSRPVNASTDKIAKRDHMYRTHIVVSNN